MHHQLIAATTASLTAMMSGSAFSWITQILVGLTSRDSVVPMTEEESWLVISIIELGNLIAPITIVGQRMNCWGRKPFLLLSILMFLLSWILVLSTRSVLVLYFVRFIQGTGMGITFKVLPIYLEETVEPRYRGMLIVFSKAMWFLGMQMQYILAPYVSYQALAWSSICVPILAVAFLAMPETPYFLLLVDREDDALNSLVWLRGGEKAIMGEVVREMKEIKLHLAEDLIKYISCSRKDLVFTPEHRLCFIIALVVGTLEVLSGISAIMSYVTNTLSNSLGDSVKAEQYTMLIGFCILVSTIISAAIVELVRHRTLIITSYLGAALCQFCSAGYFYIKHHTYIDTTCFDWIPFITIACYTILFCGGVSAVSTIIQRQMFSTHNSDLGIGIVTMSSSLASYFCLQLYCYIQRTYGVYLNFLLYGFCALMGSLFLNIYLPETKGLTWKKIHYELVKLKIFRQFRR